MKDAAAFILSATVALLPSLSISQNLPDKGSRSYCVDSLGGCSDYCLSVLAENCDSIDNGISRMSCYNNAQDTCDDYCEARDNHCSSADNRGPSSTQDLIDQLRERSDKLNEILN